MSRISASIVFALASDGLLASCNPGPSTTAVGLKSGDLPTFPSDPSGFVSQITNPYLAFAPGRKFHYRSETADGVETNTVEVTTQTKTILGIAATVVHDSVYLNGSLTEDTFDWFAQDTAGNVWYLGEDSKQIQNGIVVGTEGSWEAGVNGAQAGIVMLAHPKVGTQYQQEFAVGVAEDMAKVTNLSATVELTFASCTNCLKTDEWTHLEPGAREQKFYKPGVGLLLTVEKGGGANEELTGIEN